MKKNLCKKTLALLLALLMLALALVGCSAKSATADASQSLLQKVLNSGKIVVTLNLGNEPWGYTDENGEYGGMAVELIRGFADQIGVQAEFSPLEFSSMIPAIQSDKADIICTNLTRKASRATSVTFTEPVGCSYVVAVVQKNTLTTVESLNDSNVTLTTEAGSIHEDIAKEHFPNAQMSAVNQNADAIAALKAGRANAFLTDLSVAQAACDADDSITIIDTPIYVDTFAFAVKCDASSWTFVEAFNTYMRLIKDDGTYGKLYEQYFGEPWSPITTEVGM